MRTRSRCPALVVVPPRLVVGRRSSLRLRNYIHSLIPHLLALVPSVLHAMSLHAPRRGPATSCAPAPYKRTWCAALCFHRRRRAKHGGVLPPKAAASSKRPPAPGASPVPFQPSRAALREITLSPGDGPNFPVPLLSDSYGLLASSFCLPSSLYLASSCASSLSSPTFDHQPGSVLT